MSFNDLLSLLLTHKWLGAMALSVGFILRLFKSDTPLPTLPARFRPWAALALGMLSSVLDHRVNGTDWKSAILAGLLAGLVAMAGHDTLVESLRRGKEPFSGGRGGGIGRIVLPGDESDAMKAKLLEKDTPKKPDKLLLENPNLYAFCLAIVIVSSSFLILLCGCAGASPQTNAVIERGILSIEQEACSIAEIELGSKEPELITKACKIDPAMIEQVINLMTAKEKARILIAARKADGGAKEAGK